jgi:EAL domain-containing protein (putative c-di-GMP-specific phosphodiesterase class I)
VSVNVVGPQLQQPSFVDEVIEILESSGLEAQRLVLEMTESTLMADSESNLEKLRYLQDSGVGLAIDDFGTGYSSLSYLRRFDMDILKIDKSFVDRLGHDPVDSALVAAMVGLGASLGMKVIAEGIELHDQLEELRSLRCDLGQGYLFSKPVLAEAFEAMLVPEAVILIPEHAAAIASSR